MNRFLWHLNVFFGVPAIVVMVHLIRKMVIFFFCSFLRGSTKFSQIDSIATNWVKPFVLEILSHDRWWIIGHQFFTPRKLIRCQNNGVFCEKIKQKMVYYYNLSYVRLVFFFRRCAHRSFNVDLGIKSFKVNLKCWKPHWCLCMCVQTW